MSARYSTGGIWGGGGFLGVGGNLEEFKLVKINLGFMGISEVN